MKAIYTQETIDEIYEEGDRDNLSFGFLTNYVESESTEQSVADAEFFEKTLDLSRYLVSTGDFLPGRTKRINDEVQFIVYENGFADFEIEAKQFMRDEGLRCDALSWEIMLIKVTFLKKYTNIINRN